MIQGATTTPPTPLRYNYAQNPSFETNTTSWSASTPAYHLGNTSLTNLATNPSFETNTTGWAQGANYYLNNSTRLNRILNPSFETDVSNWADYAPSAPTSPVLAQYSGGGVSSGAWSLRYTATSQSGGASSPGISTALGTSAMPLNGLTTFTAAAQVFPVGAAGGGMQIIILWYDAAGAFISSSASATDTATGRHQISVTGTRPTSPSAVYAAVRIVAAVSVAASSAVEMRVDAVQFCAEAALYPYFDGASSGASWTTPANATNNSTSTVNSTVLIQSSQPGAPYVGTQAGRVTTTGISSLEGNMLTITSTFTAGVTYTASAYIKTATGSVPMALAFGAAAAEPGATASITATATYQRFSISWTPAATQSVAYFVVRTPSGAATATQWFMDAVQVQTGASATTYFDGDSLNGSWFGTAHGSTSNQDGSVLARFFSPTPYIGTAGGKISTTGHSGAEGIAMLLNPTTFTAGQPYVLSAYVRVYSGTLDVDLFLGRASNDSAQARFTLTTTWQRISVVWTPNVTNQNIYAGIRTHLGGTPQSTAAYYIDAVQVETGSSATPYFDGATAGASWIGTVNNSTSADGPNPFTMAAGTNYLSYLTSVASGNVIKATAYIDGLGVGVGDQTFTFEIRSSADVLLATSAPVTILDNAAGAWVDFSFLSAFSDGYPITAQTLYNLHMVASAASNSATLYQAGANNLSVFLTTFTPSSPAPDTASDNYIGALGWASTQEVFASTSPVPKTALRATAGWYGGVVESHRGAFAVVSKNGPLANYLGERVRVTYNEKSVAVYVIDERDILEDISLTRSAFLHLERLNTDEIQATVEILGAT